MEYCCDTNEILIILNIIFYILTNINIQKKNCYAPLVKTYGPFLLQTP